MTDNEIIKALECCMHDDCDNCPNNFGNCYANLAGFALDFINRQKAEKEALIAGQYTFAKFLAEQKAEIERLKKHIQEGIDLAKQIPEMLALAKAEAIKEFVERLKDKFPNGYGAFNSYDIIETMDDLVKEMEREQNG